MLISQMLRPNDHVRFKTPHYALAPIAGLQMQENVVAIEDQQLSWVSRTNAHIFRVTHENPSHTLSPGTTIAVESKVSYGSAPTGVASRRHSVRLFTIALRIVSSFRMQAVNANFFAFPA
jgi:hypothetical protein